MKIAVVLFLEESSVVMDARIKSILEAYVTKANDLKPVEFFDHVQETGLGFHAHVTEDNETWEYTFDLPDNDKRNAMLLTFRQFIQDRDTISFPALKHLIDNEELSEEWRTNVEEVRRAYFDFLQQRPSYIESGFLESGTDPNNEKIMRVVLFGQLAHTNVDGAEWATFQKWTRDKIRRHVLEQVFIRIVVQVLAYIHRIAKLTEDELRALD